MSSTNDEQAKYSGSAENAHTEQPKEREPMLPILTTYDEHKSKYGMLGRELYFIDGWGKGADAYRTAMDELITTGKLRVVVEVDVDNVSTYPGDFRCSACDGWTRSVLLNYCPGCGNKIKR